MLLVMLRWLTAGDRHGRPGRSLGGYATGRLAQAWQLDPEWYAPADGGFRWWGFRLEQQVVAEKDDEGGLVLRAATTVLRNVPDQDAAVSLIAELNQRSGTFALYYENARHRVVAVSAAWMAGRRTGGGKATI